MTTVYGIKNCDTIKKARKWLEARGIDYRFHDYRADGLSAEQLGRWADQLSWERLLNRSGTTFRRLPAERTAGLDEARALDLMLEQPALIRRPLVEADGRLLLGFKEAEFAAFFGAAA